MTAVGALFGDETLPRPAQEVAPGCHWVPGWLDAGQQAWVVRQYRRWAAGPVPAHRPAVRGGRMSVTMVPFGWVWTSAGYARTGEQDEAPLPVPEPVAVAPAAAPPAASQAASPVELPPMPAPERFKNCRVVPPILEAYSPHGGSFSTRAETAMFTLDAALRQLESQCLFLVDYRDMRRELGDARTRFEQACNAARVDGKRCEARRQP